jgi:uncharacterized NAD-dependent epimerase/dehydratase family protein
MDPTPNVFDGNAIVYCEGAFNTTNGKTAHGLVRFTDRYRVLAVIDSRWASRDAGEVLDGRSNGIPICRDLPAAIKATEDQYRSVTHFVVGLAPDGGRLAKNDREAVKAALRAGLNVDSGLHDFLSEDAHLVSLARRGGVRLRDIRKPPLRSELHFFTGRIEKVQALKIAVLGTDSAVGKRTTAWLLVKGLRRRGYAAEMIGTGQTAWFQGIRFGVVMDALVNDFVSGEIEHAVCCAWEEARPDLIVIEGQGSLMNPAYPGGFEILAAGRPDIVILQHAPARKEYDGFPGYPLHPLTRQIEAIELLSGKPVVAVTINHENLDPASIDAVYRQVQARAERPVFDVLAGTIGPLIDTLLPWLERKGAA